MMEHLICMIDVPVALHGYTDIDTDVQTHAHTHTYTDTHTHTVL